MTSFVPCQPPDSVSITSSPVSYFSFSTRPQETPATVTLFPACSSPASLDLMCPKLLSNGRPCTENGTCSLNPGSCVAGGSGRASCTYNVDLIKNMQDLSFMLRSTSRDNQGRFPIPTAGVLAKDFGDRMMALPASTKVTPHMKADVSQVVSKNKTLRGFVNEKNWGDYRSMAEVPAWGGEPTDWGPIYWEQAKWLVGIMSKDSAMPSNFGQGNSCYVNSNYSSENIAYLKSLFGESQL